MKHDLEKLYRFINSIGSHESPSLEDMQAASHALMDILNSREGKAVLGIKRKPGQRGKKYSHLDITIDHPLFFVVQKLEARKIDESEAIREFEEYYENTKIDVRTIKKLIEGVLPRARDINAFIQKISND